MKRPAKLLLAVVGAWLDEDGDTFVTKADGKVVEWQKSKKDRISLASDS